MNGDEKLKMFDGLCNKTFNLKNTFVNELAIKNIGPIHKIWTDFFTIYTRIKSCTFELNEREESVLRVKEDCANWLNTFKSVYHKSEV
jgi:hypothetical protein